MPTPQYQKQTLTNAKVLRADATPAERALWDIVRAGKLGARFRRQQPIGPFIADFYCAAAALVIELDGKGHADTLAYDARRTAWLENAGYRVLRFANADVLDQPSNVYRKIMTLLQTPHPGAARHPSPSRGEGSLAP